MTRYGLVAYGPSGHTTLWKLLSQLPRHDLWRLMDAMGLVRNKKNRTEDQRMIMSKWNQITTLWLCDYIVEVVGTSSDVGRTLQGIPMDRNTQGGPSSGEGAAPREGKGSSDRG